MLAEAEGSGKVTKTSAHAVIRVVVRCKFSLTVCIYTYEAAATYEKIRRVLLLALQASSLRKSCPFFPPSRFVMTSPILHFLRLAPPEPPRSLQASRPFRGDAFVPITIHSARDARRKPRGAQRGQEQRDRKNGYPDDGDGEARHAPDALLSGVSLPVSEHGAAGPLTVAKDTGAKIRTRYEMRFTPRDSSNAATLNS